MAMLLSEARTIVADHLDDSSNDRWSTSQIDTGLKFALGACMSEYVAGGGDRLEEIVSQSTDTSGIIDLSSFDPYQLVAVSMTVGTRFFPIAECQYEERGLNDGNTRPLQIRLIRKRSLSTNASDPLIQVGAVASKTFDAFDHWICARAALFCSVKDAEQRPELRIVEQELRKAVMTFPSMPKAMAFPDRPHWYSNWFNWSWIPDSQKLQLSRRGWF